MIDENEVVEAAATLTQALVELRLTWIVDAVNLKESEISATADLVRVRRRTRGATPPSKSSARIITSTSSPRRICPRMKRRRARRS